MASQTVRRCLIGIGAASALTGATAAPSMAVPSTSAVNAPSYNSTHNVPYLAWAGQHVHVKVCDAFLNTVPYSMTTPLVTVEDFGGGQPLPSILGRATPNDGWAKASDGNWCWGQDVSSAVRGLWEFQIQATNSAGVTKTWKQLVGWMRPTTPVLHEISATDPTGDALLGDPLGDGMFTAGSLPGRIQVKIKGTMPTQIGSSGSTIPINTVLTLPDDWRRMADAYAQDNRSPIPGSQSPSAVAGWDIHDDDVIRPDLRDGGLLPVVVPPALPPLPGLPDGIPDGDPVYNVNNGDTQFNRLDSGTAAYNPVALIFTPPNFGATSAANTAGPFDPVRFDETLLRDGKVDSGDAPMPALPVHFKIQPNLGSGIGGVGFFSSVDKSQVYRVNRPGSDTLTGHLPAPFYDQYIPATRASGLKTASAGSYLASGTTGIGSGNFAGYDYYNATSLEPYTNWLIAKEVVNTAPLPSKCLERFYRAKEMPFQDWDRGPYGGGWIARYRLLPYGVQEAAVFTDEHGEAQIAWNPGTAFYWDALTGVFKNKNGGCDLQGVQKLGFADIVATAVDPWQPTFSSAASAPLTKMVLNKFSKTIQIVPKSNDPNDVESNVARLAIVHAVDVDGEPFRHELVCLTTSSVEGVRLFHWKVDLNGDGFLADNPALLGTDYYEDFTGQQRAWDPDGDRVCARTNHEGYAVFEVINSLGTLTDITADFVEEGLFRSAKVYFNQPGQAPIANPTPSVAGAAGNTPDGPGLIVGEAAALAPVAGGGAPPIVVVPAAATSPIVKSIRSKAKVSMARLISRPSGTYIQLRLSGKTMTARVQVTLLRKNGKVTARTIRRVKVGKIVNLRSIRIPSFVGSVRIKVL